VGGAARDVEAEARRRTVRGVTLLLTAIILLLLVSTAHAQNVVPLAEGVEVAERSSNPAKLYGTNGANLFINTGAIIGIRDLQMGWWDPAVPSLVNGDIGAGSTEHPGILNLGADVSRKVRLQAEGRTVFETRPGGVDVLGTIRLCQLVCADLQQILWRHAVRLALLERRVRRLRARGR
jgi:hypothetical protein